MYFFNGAAICAKVQALPPSAYVDIRCAGGAFANTEANIFRPLTKKEGDAYRKQVQQKLINNKNISRRAINKMIGSAANSRKVEILENLDGMTSQKPLHTINAGSPKYTYEIHPVQTQYGPDVAVGTKKNGHIYNASPWEFFEEGYRKKSPKGGTVTIRVLWRQKPRLLVIPPPRGA